jgi:hypothetical protein
VQLAACVAWLPAVRDPVCEREPVDRIVPATRPLAHAAAVVGLTLAAITAPPLSGAESPLRDLIVLVVGGGAAVASLVHARHVLQGAEHTPLALPDGERLAAWLGLRVDERLRGAPLFELTVIAAAATTVAMAPWAVLVIGALARVWRWYAGSSARHAAAVAGD